MDPPQRPWPEPIATSYDELQGLPDLFAVSRDPDLAEPGSARQAARSLWQASELSVATMAESIVPRAGGSEHELGRSIAWSVAFARTWVAAARALTLTRPLHEPVPSPHIDFARLSPNWQALQEAESLWLNAYMRIRRSTTRSRIDDDVLTYTHLQRVALEHMTIAVNSSDYRSFARPDELAAIVHTSPLDPGTVFVQFRSAHQVSEILVDAVNDHIELVLDHFASGEAHESLMALRRVEDLLHAIVTAVETLAETLTQDEYHRIREHLGLTSGSHSVGLHYDLMRDLYPRLAREAIGRRRDSEGELVQVSVRAIGQSLDRWRSSHFRLPREQLGGTTTGTRSLTGSLDAAHTVAQMRERARARDPFTRGGRTHLTGDDSVFRLAELERNILNSAADLTHERFPNVQKRTGFFSRTSRHSAPPSRFSHHDRGTKGDE